MNGKSRESQLVRKLLALLLGMTLVGVPTGQVHASATAKEWLQEVGQGASSTREGYGLNGRDLHFLDLNAIVDTTVAEPDLVRKNVKELLTQEDASVSLERRLRRLKRNEIAVPHMLAARNLVRAHKNSPLGTEVHIEIDGASYVARVERHFHPEGGPVRPWGFHVGVSLFVAR